MDKENWPELLTVAEVATALRCSKMTVYRLCRSEDGNPLRAIRVGRGFRIPADGLRAYLKAAAG